MSFPLPFKYKDWDFHFAHMFSDSGTINNNKNIFIIKSVVHSCSLMFYLRYSQTKGETVPS